MEAVKPPGEVLPSRKGIESVNLFKYRWVVFSTCELDLNSTIETRGMFWLVFVLALLVLFTPYLVWMLQSNANTITTKN